MSRTTETSRPIVTRVGVSLLSLVRKLVTTTGRRKAIDPTRQIVHVVFRSTRFIRSVTLGGCTGRPIPVDDVGVTDGAARGKRCCCKMRCSEGMHGCGSRTQKELAAARTVGLLRGAALASTQKYQVHIFIRLPFPQDHPLFRCRPRHDFPQPITAKESEDAAACAFMKLRNPDDVINYWDFACERLFALKL
jgi:hypothetical protein